MFILSISLQGSKPNCNLIRPCCAHPFEIRSNQLSTYYTDTVVCTHYTLHTNKEITATGKSFVVVENKTWFSEGVVLHCGMSLYCASGGKLNVHAQQVSSI